jgi:hypothetical protein
MTTPVLAPMLLIPTGNPTPVEKAAADSIVGDFEPETFLWISFHRPDGSVRVWYAWTQGGQPLGDHIDRHAIAAGYDSSDWLHISGRHLTEHHRGRIKTQAHPLRPIEADLRNGVRAPESKRDKLRRLLDHARELNGQTRAEPTTTVPRWLGVGPTLLAKKN